MKGLLRSFVSFAQVFLAYLALSVACFLMLRIAAAYVTFESDVMFLREKQDYISDPLWQGAFYVHVFTAVIALLAGFTQFSDDWRRDHPQWHRRVGRVYVWCVLAVNVPAGMVLALNANGMLPGRAAFVLLDVLWFWFTYRAYACARRRDFVRHREFMIRSYALTLAAITLRSWKWFLSSHFTIDPVHLYMIDAWLSFIPNMIVAEMIIRRSRKKRISG